MTVTYSLDVSSSSFWCLHKLLFRWKGSIWKCVWSELIVWLSLYTILSTMYRLALNPEQRLIFEDVCIFFETYSGFIPITFMLGFYVNAVFTRWGKIFDNIGWIDTPALMITQAIQGSSERTRIIRRNCLRYMVLTQAIVFRDVSKAVRKRFPTMFHLVTAGLMTESELDHFENVVSPHKKYWQPMHWLFSNIRIARDEGYVKSDIVYVDLVSKIRDFRSQVLNLTLYDWVPVPLVYTQVVHLAVRSFFAIALLGRQYLKTSRNPDEIGLKQTIDLYVPVMTILQFIFFVGWMKVAEVLLNPLGEDDDDFEVNYILDRNLQVGLAMVDGAHNKFPTLEKDHFWEDLVAEPLYTIESAARPSNPQIGSCANLEGTEDDHYMLRPRRHTSYSSKINLDYDESDIVRVQGLDKIRKSGSIYNSGESLAASQSFAVPTRKLSEMFKRLKGGRPSISLSTKRALSRGEGVSEEGAVRSTSFDSMDRFDESFHNGVAPPPPPTQHSALTPLSFSNSSNSLSADQSQQGETSPGIDGSKNMIWTVDEMLPIIEEEEHEKRRHSDGDSFHSGQSTGTSSTSIHVKTHKDEVQRNNVEADVDKINNTNELKDKNLKKDGKAKKIFKKHDTDREDDVTVKADDSATNKSDSGSTKTPTTTSKSPTTSSARRHDLRSKSEAHKKRRRFTSE
ncbi:unnamed protein product [Auanema sp. JU1783]|nr:unnamed protein product [Auanema sp. JU1783]